MSVKTGRNMFYQFRPSEAARTQSKLYFCHALQAKHVCINYNQILSGKAYFNDLQYYLKQGNSAINMIK